MVNCLQSRTRWTDVEDRRLMAYGELDPSSGIPLYRQIKEILRREVADGTADPRKPMTEVQLLDRFEVSRAPIRQALQELASEGYVYRKQGKGTFPVTGIRVRRPADVQPGALHEYLSDSGLHPASRVSGIERVEPPAAIGDRLGLEEGERLLHFTRLISVEDAPLLEASVYMRAPEDFTPTAEELEDEGSAFKLLERRFGITLDRAEHEAWATAASADRAATFGVGEGSPLLVIETIFFTTGGRPAGWRSAVHRAEDFKYRFTTSR
jgi:GntR family transcriptional regulator